MANEIPPVKDWPHAPVHRLDGAGVYIVTAATLNKRHLFKPPNKLTMLENELLSLAKKYTWQLEAWAVFSNHYHFIARGSDDSANLKQLISHLHSNTARELNLRQLHWASGVVQFLGHKIDV